MLTDTGARRARWAAAWPGLVVALVTLALDVRALLPGVGLWDTAEFQTIGPVLGIAHPTGFPSYTMLAWVASVVLQPFGDAALRANLLSALLAAAATGLTATAVLLLTRRAVLAVAAGLALAAAPTPWAIGLRADAHALHFALVALLLVLLVVWRERERRAEPGAGRWLVLAAFVFGISLGNHALTALLAPSIGLYVLAAAPTLVVRRPRLVAACVATLALTVVAVYAYLPIRSSMDPPLDYGNPDNWERFRFLVFGEQFRGTFSQLPDVATLVSQAGTLLVEQFGVLAPLAPLGALATAVRRPALALLTVPWFAVTLVFAAAYVNADITRYHLVPLLVASVWIALAAESVWVLTAAVWRKPASSRPISRTSGALDASRDAFPGVPEDSPPPSAAPGAARRRVAAALASLAVGVVLVVPPVAAMPRTLERVDASDERAGQEWLDAALANLAPDAVVISWWSFSTPLWYGQFVEGRRPDVLVIDDRTIVDGGLGSATAVVDRYLGTRPVYVIRLGDEIRQLQQRYSLRQLRGIPSWGPVWEVIPPPVASEDAAAVAPFAPRRP